MREVEEKEKGKTACRRCVPVISKCKKAEPWRMDDFVNGFKIKLSIFLRLRVMSRLSYLHCSVLR